MNGLRELNIGFNEISADGFLPVVGCLASNKTIRILTLSGNVIDNAVAKVLSNTILMNRCLECLYVDRCNLTSVGERLIATGVASNQNNSLRILTGFALGKVLCLLGSPAIVRDMTNEAALKYLNQMWNSIQKASPKSPADYNSYPPTPSSYSGSVSDASRISMEVLEKTPRLLPPPFVSFPDKTTVVVYALLHFLFFRLMVMFFLHRRK
jgi:hypothetical protein